MEIPTLVIAAVAVVLFASVYFVAYLFSHSPRLPVASELKYRTNDYDNKTYDLPTRIDPNSTFKDTGIEISVVVPCYNETKRLEKMMDDCLAYFSGTHKYDYEIIVVDDKSSDGTSEYAIDLARKYNMKPHTLKVVELSKNRGKGGAVTHGMLHSAGKYVLFADADGATSFKDVEALLGYLKQVESKKGAIAIGSRAHMVNTEAVVKRSFIRNFLMHGLHALVFVFGIKQVQDTQCGFKMFNFEAVKQIFPHMHTERWIFDVEILLIATYQKIQMKEIPVNWQEIDGLKVDLVTDSINMAIDLVVTRICYILGIYKLNMNNRAKLI